MKLNYLWVGLLILVLTGCEKDVDEDGVPKIDLTAHLSDIEAGKYRAVRTVKVQGKDMSLDEFKKTYCLGKIGNIFRSGNKTCDQVANILNVDGARQPG